MRKLADETYQRPKKQWWLDLQPIANLLAQPASQYQPESE
jgi:hypothetical protein